MQLIHNLCPDLAASLRYAMAAAETMTTEHDCVDEEDEIAVNDTSPRYMESPKSYRSNLTNRTVTQFSIDSSRTNMTMGKYG